VDILDAAGAKTASYLLNSCGTALPDTVDVNDYDATVSIPLTSIAATSTSALPFFELLGVRTAIHKVTAPVTSLSSPCLVKAVEDGTLEAGTWEANTISEDNFNVEVTFGNSPGANLTDVDSFFVPFNEWQEPDILGQQEYIKLASVFFNKEASANALFADSAARLTCVQHNIQEHLRFKDEVLDKKVLWAAYSVYGGGWALGQCVPCPTCIGGSGPYYCEAAGIIGVEFNPDHPTFDSNTGPTYLNHTAFAKYATAFDADVLMYPDSNLATILADTENFGYLADLKAVKNRQVSEGRRK